MCGIVGMFCRRGLATQERLLAAMDAVGHRGPDESGLHLDGLLGLGHRRLSIIDLADGQQPMTDASGSLWITYNGEIYNFAAIRRELEEAGRHFRTRSDTEVLIEAYRTYGRDCLSRFRGMFAFALWDSTRRELFVARDRLGVKPVFYAETEDGFFLASEIPALFSLADIPRAVDAAALHDYLTLQYVPAPRTGFAAIRKLPPAHWLVVRDGRIAETARYWDVTPRSSFRGAAADAEEQVRTLLAEATRLRMISDVPLGAFLSGGVDSSVTVALMARAVDRPVKTFCVGFQGSGLDERTYAREVARRYGTEHEEVDASVDVEATLRRLVRQAGTPFADASLVPTYAVSAAGQKAITVALTGDGGDEAFGGYKRYGILGFAERARRMGVLPAWKAIRKGTLLFERFVNPRRRQKRYPAGPADHVLEIDNPVEQYLMLTRIFGPEAIAAIVQPGFHARWDPGDTVRPLEQRWAEFEGADAICRWMDLDRNFFLAEDVLHKVDISSMAASLECRSPFLDHRVVEFAATLPAAFLVDPLRKRGKQLLKSAFREWLPAAVLDRPKMGFTPPVADWLRQELRAVLADQLLASGTFFDVFKKEPVAWLVEQHRNGSSSHGKALWTLLSLRLWWDTFGVTLS